MSTNFHVLLTNAGAALQTNAWQGGDKINLTHFQIGSDATEVTATQIEVSKPATEKTPISELKQKEDDAGVLEVICIIPPEVGGFMMNSIGLFTDSGILFAVASLPSDYKPVATEGSSKETVITLYIALGSTESINLTIDPYKVIATQDWVNNDSTPAKHMADFNNPHKVTAAQVGAPTTTAFNNHANNKNNPHNVTAAQVGAPTTTAFNNHANNKNNPHKVTAAQVGAPTTTAFNNHANNKSNPHNVTAAQVGAPTTTAFNNHANNKNNPHNVTAAQVGAWSKGEIKRMFLHSFTVNAGHTHAINSAFVWKDIGSLGRKSITLKFQKSKIYMMGSANIKVCNHTSGRVLAEIHPRVGGVAISRPALCVADGVYNDRDFWIGGSYAFSPMGGYRRENGALVIDFIKRAFSNANDATVYFDNVSITILEVED